MYFLPVIYLLSFTFYFFILPLNWKIEIDGIITNLIAENRYWKFFLKGITNIVIFTIVSYLLIEVLKIHDHFYDRYIIRWRKYYDRDFILPRLCKPFLSNTSSDRFFEEANHNKSRFMQELYYPFVGDEIEKINKNLRTRFYEVITIYWFTQVNEFAFILSFIILNILAISTRDQGLLQNLPFYLLFLLILFIINWLWRKANHPKLENATIAQINDIHDNPALLKELEDRFKRICSRYNIPLNG